MIFPVVMYGCESWTVKKAAKAKAKVTQSCPTLCDPMDCSLSGSSIHGILQAGILEWVAISFSMEAVLRVAIFQEHRAQVNNDFVRYEEVERGLSTSSSAMRLCSSQSSVNTSSFLCSLPSPV